MTDNSSVQPAGWYYAQGDPPGTHRYWDGNAWVGGPQAVGGVAQAVGGASYSGAVRAEAGDRFIAYLIDGGIVMAGFILLVLVMAILSVFSETLSLIIAGIGYLGLVAFSLYNSLYLQGKTGQTIGKKKMKIEVLKSDTLQPVGVGMVFVRLLLQGLFSMPCYLDHWWILVDADNRRLSDKVLDMHVYKA